MNTPTETQEREYLAQAMERFAAHLRGPNHADGFHFIQEGDTHKGCMVFGLSITEGFELTVRGEGNAPEFFTQALNAAAAGVQAECGAMQLLMVARALLKDKYPEADA